MTKEVLKEAVIYKIVKGVYFLDNFEKDLETLKECNKYVHDNYVDSVIYRNIKDDETIRKCFYFILIDIECKIKNFLINNWHIKNELTKDAKTEEEANTIIYDLLDEIIDEYILK